MAGFFFFFADGSPVRWDRLPASWFRDWPRNWFSAIVSISASRFRCFFSFFSCSSAFFNDFYWSSTAGLDVFPKIYTVRYYWLAVQGQVIGGSFLSTKYWISELATASARFPHRFHRFFAFFFCFFFSLCSRSRRAKLSMTHESFAWFFFSYIFFCHPPPDPIVGHRVRSIFLFLFFFLKSTRLSLMAAEVCRSIAGTKSKSAPTRVSLFLSLSLSSATVRFRFPCESPFANKTRRQKDRWKAHKKKQTNEPRVLSTLFFLNLEWSFPRPDEKDCVGFYCRGKTSTLTFGLQSVFVRENVHHFLFSMLSIDDRVGFFFGID